MRLVIVLVTAVFIFAAAAAAEPSVALYQLHEQVFLLIDIDVQ
jgi:hypothetical protein